MKVIIVEVTRAANTFARTHMDQIGESYDRITKIVSDGQVAGILRTDIDAYFASMSFYGAIEQVLTSWIFDLRPVEEADYDNAADLVVKTICEGLEKR